MATRSEDEYSFSDLPGWAQALALTLAALYVTWALMPTWKFLVVWGLLAFVGLVTLLAYLNESNDSPGLLAKLLSSVTETTDADSVEKVDRLSSYQKSKLKDAVGMECEVTGCDTKRSLHVHHITPRSEGGGNELRNLIVVCRNHHADCDNGSFNRTQQREMIRGDRFVDEGIKDYWHGSVS
jgi:hypothetical protein